MKKTLYCIAVILIGLFTSTVAISQTGNTLVAKPISKNIILVQTERGMDTQLAINSDKGIVVFGTHWGPAIEKEYRAVIEREFGNSNFKYVVNPKSRIISCGGNVLYKDALIVADDEVYNEMVLNKTKLNDEIQREVNLFNEKAERSRNILKQGNLSVDDQAMHSHWMNYCQRIADDLKAGYDLVLPSFVFENRFTMNLGNMILHMENFAGAGTIINIPEEKFLMFNGMFDPLHIIGPPRGKKLEIDQWISILEKYLSECSNYEQVVLGYKGIWPLKKIEDRKNFMIHLWNEIKKATDEGLDFEQVEERLSIDSEFSYIKNWDLYRETGDAWVREDFEKILFAFWVHLHPVISTHIDNFIKDNGPEKGLEELKDILKNRRKDYYISQSALNTLGYRLLNKEMNDPAIEVFTINVDLYPASADVYDSLGEAYMKSGQKDLAIKNYQKSLELNPQNSNALEKLRVLK
ncbi:MAG: tetratricopeptide repeat protein [Bacteroidetes bacterium]|nr:tetratricopeptide repeat protein [Bacteroidota bacterium]